MADHEHAEHAAKALDAYEQVRYRDDGTSHRTNPQIADATVEALLRDLLHYADVSGIPFEEALGAARRSYAEDCVTDSPDPYELGDRVQLRPGCALPGTRAALPQRGTVVMVDDASSCVVE